MVTGGPGVLVVSVELLKVLAAFKVCRRFGPGVPGEVLVTWGQ